MNYPRQVCFTCFVLAESVLTAQVPQFRWEMNRPFAAFKGSPEEQAKMVSLVIEKSNSIEAQTIYIAANTAFVLNQFCDAGFLYYVARIRSFFDLNAFEPTTSGSSHPSVYIGFLNGNARQYILPWLFTHLDVFEIVISRLEKWDPNVMENYHPGWEYSGIPSQKVQGLTRSEFRTKYIEGFVNMTKLFKINTYKDNFMAINPYLPATLEMKRTPEGKVKFDSHMKALLEIEQKTGIKGYASTQ